jgi:uncharacterized pyridoxamine 5'-phosphate oxidase family protein
MTKQEKSAIMISLANRWRESGVAQEDFARENDITVHSSASGKNMWWLRIEAKVIFADNLDIKRKVFECSPLVKSIYKNPINPEFEVFYLSESKASISEIGKPPIYYSL